MSRLSNHITTHTVGYDYVWAALAAAIYAAIDIADRGNTLLGTVDHSTRSALYISLAATTGALLGFAVTAITILLTLGTGRRMDWLFKHKRFSYTRHIFLGAIHTLALATIYFSALIVTDTRTHSKAGLEYVGVLIIALVLLRVRAVVKLLGDLLDIAIKDRADDETPNRNPPFQQPT